MSEGIDWMAGDTGTYKKSERKEGVHRWVTKGRKVGLLRIRTQYYTKSSSSSTRVVVAGHSAVLLPPK